MYFVSVDMKLFDWFYLCRICTRLTNLKLGIWFAFSCSFTRHNYTSSCTVVYLVTLICYTLRVFC